MWQRPFVFLRRSIAVHRQPLAAGSLDSLAAASAPVFQKALAVLAAGGDVFRPERADEWRSIRDAIALALEQGASTRNPEGQCFYNAVQKRMTRAASRASTRAASRASWPSPREERAAARSDSRETMSPAQEVKVRTAGPAVLAMAAKCMRQPTGGCSALREDLFTVLDAMIHIRAKLAEKRTACFAGAADLSPERQKIAVLFRKHEIPFEACGSLSLYRQHLAATARSQNSTTSRREDLAQIGTFIQGLVDARKKIEETVRPVYSYVENPDGSSSIACRLKYRSPSHPVARSTHLG